MSEPVADHVPPLPPLPPGDPERLDVVTTASGAFDLDAAQAGPAMPPTPAAASDVRAAVDPAAIDPAAVDPATVDPATLTRAQRRALAEQEAAAKAAEASVLDHPAVLIGLSVLTLVAVVIGVDQASQGNVLLLVPAVLLVAAYVVVVRRRRARR
jgi:hypothetical protein